ncbi:hypothetical protein D3C77_363090 [compost metagenome]
MEGDGQVALTTVLQGDGQSLQSIDLVFDGMLAGLQVKAGADGAKGAAEHLGRCVQGACSGKQFILLSGAPFADIDQIQGGTTLDCSEDLSDFGCSLFKPRQGGGVMVRRRKPIQTGRKDVLVLQRDPQRLIGGPAVGIGFVKRFDIGVEHIPTDLKALIDRDPRLLIGAAAIFPGRFQLGQEAPPVSLVGMQLDAEVAQAMFAQSSIDHIKGCGLFRHEQHCFSDRQAVCDHVGDCLALAGAGRADDDEVTSLGSG